MENKTKLRVQEEEMAHRDRLPPCLQGIIRAPCLIEQPLETAVEALFFIKQFNVNT